MQRIPKAGRPGWLHVVLLRRLLSGTDWRARAGGTPSCPAGGVQVYQYNLTHHMVAGVTCASERQSLGVFVPLLQCPHLDAQ